MTLVKYKQKRNFRQTREPKGKVASHKGDLIFVVQRHKASHLHYDFRLELEGVLKSWAVPKGPSMNPKDKRLAMMVEDHPFDYKDFEGVIPEGNYGAGIVEIWDRGTYTDIEGSGKKEAEQKLLEELGKGSIKFMLHGNKLKGEFALVKMKGRGENTWLLIKHRDEYAMDREYNSEDETDTDSPINRALKATGSGQLKKKSANSNGRHKPAIVTGKKLTRFLAPMLARETDKPFDDPNWTFEIKWDGYRAITELNGHDVKLYSRNGISFNERYALVTQELKKMNLNAVIDGEIVVLDEKGVSNFQLLQDYLRNPHYPLLYYVFDLLWVNGKNVCGLRLLERKNLLKKLLKKSSMVIFSDHIKERGKDFFKETGRLGIEGMMAKKADGQYYSGKRTSEWLKVKHHKTGEAIIAGFTEPGGSRKHFGALVLGVRNNGSLKYAGHTGTGFNDKTLNEIYNILKPRIISRSPFSEKVKTNMPVTWVKPELVAELKFTERTNDGKMRHPVFLRLRTDKPAKEVTIKSETLIPEKEIKEGTAEKTKLYTFGKIKVKTSNPDKIFFPDEKITKSDVIDYYQSIAKYILPYLKGRPQSLKRNPNGILDEGFFHKDAGGEAPGWVNTKKLYSESVRKDINYIICDNAATLCYLNNLGCIELNPWNSTVSALEKPDYLIIDIDPSEKNTFGQVIEAANVFHDILKKIQAPCFCKTSGATGLHVLVPMEKKYTYEQVKDFAHILCTLVNERLPKFTTLDRNLKKRGADKIYLDYLQNRKGQTLASVYSLRPKPHATVSFPLQWKEVKPGLSPAQFTIENVPRMIRKADAFFREILGKGIEMKKCLERLES